MAPSSFDDSRDPPPAAKRVRKPAVKPLDKPSSKAAPKSAKQRPPVRVRHEPPTLEEAVIAAQGLSDDPAQQIVIAASLMNVSVEEARPLVLKAQRLAASGSRMVVSAPRTGQERTVIVERTRTRPRLTGALPGRPVRL